MIFLLLASIITLLTFTKESRSPQEATVCDADKAMSHFNASFILLAPAITGRFQLMLLIKVNPNHIKKCITTKK